ncbi:MAG: glycine--tRNA ligase subunit beta [Pseudomonadota bacterium]
MTSKNLLVELFVEELPPKSLKKIGDSFAEEIWWKLSTAGLLADKSGDSIYGETYIAYASPRRLAVWVKDVLSKAADKSVSQKLMPVAVGLDANGQPSPALLKKLGSMGADVSVVPQLKRAMDGKAEALFFDSVMKGATLAQGLQIALNEALGKLPIAKVMTYQLADGWSSVNFVRPAHGLVALHGTDIVPVGVLGLSAGHETQGHRFEASVAKVVLKDADSYAQQLESEGAVIASFAARRDEIAKQIAAAAAKENLKPIEDDALLDEVTALVERPNVLVGKFEKEFLEVPQECLILTMKANQKYFPLLDSKGKLTNRFLIVSNIHPADASLVISGNERVVRPRLADAKFFFDQDRRKTLASRVEGLRKVVYHNKLGTQGDRVERVWAIAQAIGLKLGGNTLAAQAGEAAMLAKADLLTDMVGEFPELQGIMGRYYAQHDGLSNDIAFAIEDHYKPRFAGDELPRDMVGVCVALADKLETLAGMFGIGEIPTGDKDPFALRRHALGVIRMLIEKELPLDLADLVNVAFDDFPKELLGAARKDVLFFIFERLGGMMREQGYSANEVDAVLSNIPLQIYLVPKKLEAVRAFAALPEAASLAIANKRIRNILKKAPPTDDSAIDINKQFESPEETALFNALNNLAPVIHRHFENLAYKEALIELAKFKVPVDNFFDKVMVMADDPAVRNSRLDLLRTLNGLMNQVADISKLAA